MIRDPMSAFMVPLSRIKSTLDLFLMLNECTPISRLVRTISVACVYFAIFFM